jgi:SAM-dependent methyltransferase
LKCYVDFSRVAQAYDGTRAIPIGVLEEACRRLIGRHLLSPGASVLDVGCGTGQITDVLHRAGCAVVGLDISAAMLRLARSRTPDVPVLVGSAYDLPFGDGTFDAAIVSKLFQHLRDWPAALRQIKRVLRPGGALVHVRDVGAFRNRVRRRVEAGADARGHTDRYLGVIDPGRLLPELEALGAVTVDVPEGGLRWDKTITYGEALDQLRERLFAEFWGIPDATYDAILAEVARWVAGQPEGAATRQHMHAHLELDVFRFQEVPDA